jgi:hypothetical protein
MALPPLLTCTLALTAFSSCVAAGSASIGFEAAVAPQRTWLAAVLLACPLVRLCLLRAAWWPCLRGPSRWAAVNRHWITNATRCAAVSLERSVVVV